MPLHPKGGHAVACSNLQRPASRATHRATWTGARRATAGNMHRAISLYPLTVPVPGLPMSGVEHQRQHTLYQPIAFQLFYVEADLISMTGGLGVGACGSYLAILRHRASTRSN
jgi:hypothetical protein